MSFQSSFFCHSEQMLKLSNINVGRKTRSRDMGSHGNGHGCKCKLRVVRYRVSMVNSIHPVRTTKIIARGYYITIAHFWRLTVVFVLRVCCSLMHLDRTNLSNTAYNYMPWS